MDRAFIVKAEEETISRQRPKKDGNEEPPASPASGLITFITALHVFFGLVCIVVGFVLGIDSYFNKAPYIMGGIAAGVFEFTMAVITAACKKIICR